MPDNARQYMYIGWLLTFGGWNLHMEDTYCMWSKDEERHTVQRGGLHDPPELPDLIIEEVPSWMSSMYR